jgi:hypothetical protein
MLPNGRLHHRPAAPPQMSEAMASLTNRSQDSLRKLIYPGWGPIRGADGYPIDPDVVAGFSAKYLRRQINTGAKSVANIQAWLADYGLTLKPEPATGLLNTRAKNCLRNLIYGEGRWRYNNDGCPIDPDVVSRYSASELLEYYQIGRVTLANIEAWLAASGKALKRDIAEPANFPCDLEFGA